MESSSRTTRRSRTCANRLRATESSRPRPRADDKPAFDHSPPSPSMTQLHRVMGGIDKQPSLLARLFPDILECAQLLVGHLPLPQNLVDPAGRKARRHQPPHHSRRLFLICRFGDALALQILARELLFVHLRVTGVDGLFGKS